MALRAANLNNVNASSKTKKTVEQTFTKLTQLQHILLRPDTYIGSAECVKQNVWVWDDDEKRMVDKEITYAPGLYKIFDEILVNAADHKQRDPSMNTIKVEIDPENQMISVWNNGSGIPVEMHKKEKVYVPELIFGNLLTSSNYDDAEKKVVGGRNGYGAKLANIFSTEFIVETADAENGKRYKQIFRNNMNEKDEPVIRSNPKKESYTKISFSPDLSRFGMTFLDNDIVSLLKKRVFDIAGVNTSLKVYLNGSKLPIKNFRDYVNLYVAEGTSATIAHERVNDRWEVAITASEGQLSQVSFVNSIWTIKGGTHVAHVADLIVTKISDHISKKNKGLKVKPFQIKSHLSLYINCLIENPAFDSQTKETLTTKPGKFGSKWSFTDELAKKVVRSGIVENILAFARFKQSKELSKTDGGKKVRITGIPKLDDANKAGSREASKCTLILTEGDSAKALAVSGLSVVGRDYYGVFPLRGKLLNVREAKHKQIMDNSEINNLKKILGLQHNKKYCEQTVKSLRYGHVLIMADQDHDGSHIKGLVINFFDHFWPSLLQVDGFLQEFITPIVKCVKGRQDKVFFTMPEYKRWIGEEGSASGWKSKYYKGLGTSTAAEAKGYFSNLPRHLHRFHHTGEACNDMIELAFSKQRVNDRKDWLASFSPGTFFDHEADELNYKNFVNKELILFSVADNARSIPNVIDGLKPSQRKVLFACFKRKLTKTDIKVAQLAGYVSEHAAYHHGEMSLQSTIVGLAQNFVGSNNINLLVPAGQFGTRLQGGKDAASSRYIFTKLAPIARALFPELDDPLLSYLEEDGLSIEPKWYCPVIPMVLINGADGIGTGWSSSVPAYNPHDLIANIRRLLHGESMMPIAPWYRGFRGTVVPVENSKSFDVYGILRKGSEADSFRVEELPIRSWTTPFKEFLESSIIGNTDAKNAFVKEFQDNSTENKVRFSFTTSSEHIAELSSSSAYKRLKLSTSVSTSNMVLFDAEGRIRKYDTPEEIIEEFFAQRYALYENRRLYLLRELEQELLCLDNKQRFILMVIDGKLKIAKRKKAVLLSDLKRLKFAAIPKKRAASGALMEVPGEEDVDEEESNNSDHSKDYDYLLSMPLWSLTLERVQHLREQRDSKAMEKQEMESTTAKELWERDLLSLEEALRMEEADAKATAIDLERVARQARERQRRGGANKRGKNTKLYACDDEDSDQEFDMVPPPIARVVQTKKPRGKQTGVSQEPQAPNSTRDKPKKRETKKKKTYEEEILGDEDMSDLCDDSSEAEFSGHSDGESNDCAAQLAHISLDQKPRRSTARRAAVPRGPGGTTGLERRKKSVFDLSDGVSDDGDVVKPATKRSTAARRRNVAGTSAPERNDKAEVVDLEDEAIPSKTANNRAPRTRTGSKKVASVNSSQIETAISVDSDSSDNEDTLSLSQRLAKRLTVSQAVGKNTAAPSATHGSVGSRKASTTQTKPAAGKRPRAGKAKTVKQASKAAMTSPSKSPKTKKTRIKSPKIVEQKRRSKKANPVGHDSDSSCPEDVNDEVTVVTRPRRQRSVKRVIIEESDDSLGDGEDSDFAQSVETDSDFE